MKKIVIALVTCMFVFTMLSGFVIEANDISNLERKYKEDRDVIPIITKAGLKQVPNSRGKPGAYVTITNPLNGDTVSGTVEITINSNYDPSITIDGTSVGSGLSYFWDTTQYSDGSHTIQASARGVTDTVTVTVSNGGGGNTAPTVTITNPNNGASVSGTVSITVDATDPEDGTLTADIYIDGSFITSANSYSWDTTAYSDGSHTIYAEATDSGSLSDSDEITVSVSNGGGEVDKYALVIGISDYDGTSNDLQYCDDDAQDWKNFFQSHGYSVTIITDSQATADNIESAIIQLLANEDSDDYVAFTYSGHGVDLQGYGSCMISRDMYYMTHGWFEQYFDTADSSHIYFAFDACEIGDFSGSVSTNRVGAFGSNRRLSYDGDSSMQNGVFTYYQMEGWGIYDNFEENAAYAVQGMKDWAPRFIKVDPFYSDQFSGPMLP